jgi:hypothetical protein
MSHIFQRTSITVDEAVYILLDQIDGPVVFTPVEESGWVEIDSISFCLRETLEDELEVIAGEYARAKYENQPADVIAEKHSRLQQHVAVMAQANAYLCAIKDELNKGEQSALRIDKSLSNAAYTYITLHSFNEWAKAFDKAILVSLQATAGGADAPAAVPIKKPATHTRMRQQEIAILEEIKNQGCDPLALPPHTAKAGIKAAVKFALKKSPLFEKPSAFKNTWDRLRSDKSIVDKKTPSSI